ncbi:MAG: hypothetical protein KatS3mg035_2039 [Bacteroidia bacterium]|nr:MAG: hypothetical protein KatS3mg035_2039 [Bacteroidia bacterium]
MQRLSWVSIAFFILPLTIQGQAVEKDASKQRNLVYNPSFEEHFYCPPPMFKDSFPCKGWWSPNIGTVDYFHQCSQIAEYRVPLNYYGYYQAHSGNGYVGLVLISVETLSMEHIQGQLIEPLKAGKQYKVSFWIRLAYSYSDYAACNIGVYFSREKILKGKFWEAKDSYIEGITPELTAHVSNPKGNFITDTGWVEISGIYTAKGGEIYITIGMFWDDHPKVIKAWKKAKENPGWNTTKRLGKKIEKHLLKKNSHMEKQYKDAPTKVKQHYPYYFIDDISVVELEE